LGINVENIYLQKERDAESKRTTVAIADLEKQQALRITVKEMIRMDEYRFGKILFDVVAHDI
jgi:hypothetical protein